MVEKSILTDTAGLIPLHYDVPEHSLPLKQFVNSAEALQAIIDDFNENIFDHELKYELGIIPPEKGGFIGFTTITLGATAVLIRAAWAFLNSDIGKVYIENLTNHTVEELAAALGKKHQELYLKNKDSQETIVENPYDLKLMSHLSSFTIAKMVIGFIKIKPEQLEKAGISKKKHRDAYTAKNVIIQGCIDNPNVAALGFDETHNFPISRSEFPRHIATIPLKEEIEIEPTWTVEITDIIVHSPNWKRKGKRQWQGDTELIKEISFSIEDEVFWEHVRLKDIQPDINDNMRVQWAYPSVYSKKPSNVKVLKVLTYNGTPISDQLIDEALAEALGDYSHAPPDPQTDLFEQLARASNK